MEPQIIKDIPLPVIDQTADTAQNTVDASTPSVDSQNGVTPPVVPDVPFNQPKVAVEVIGTALNTQSRQILGSFTFGQVGALKVGNYVNGVSGELDITPNGITAKNVNGVTTFSIDGTTGNATFLGTIQAGTLISGSIIVGGNANGNGTIQVVDASSAVVVQMDNTGITIYNGKLTIQDANGITVVDSQGVNSVSQFGNGSVTQSSTQNTNSTSYTDVSGTTISFNLVRTANVLITIDSLGLNVGNLVGSDQTLVALNVDGGNQGKVLLLPGILAGNGVSMQAVGDAASFILQLGSGNHTLKLQFKSNGGGQARIQYATITYAVLGK